MHLLVVILHQLCIIRGKICDEANEEEKKSEPDPHSNLSLFTNLQKFITGTLDEAKDAARQFIAVLYDPSRSHKEHHFSLNNLRTQLCVTTNDPLSKLPPCEPVFEQHVNRAVQQTKEWAMPGILI